jgi:hypothetical protein
MPTSFLRNWRGHCGFEVRYDGMEREMGYRTQILPLTRRERRLCQEIFVRDTGAALDLNPFLCAWDTRKLTTVTGR